MSVQLPQLVDTPTDGPSVDRLAGGRRSSILRLGDPRYQGGQQDVRITDERRRTVRH